MTKQRLRSRITYLWFQADTEWIELLAGAISFSFALVLVARANTVTSIDHPYVFAVLCLYSALAKWVGVIWELFWLRQSGCITGMFFWVVLCYAIYVANGSNITFGCFFVLALVQLYAMWRNARNHGVEGRA